MHKMVCEGDTMRCTQCGNTVAVDDKYNITPVGEGSVCPPLVTDWTIMERAKASEEVRIGRLPEFRKLGLGTLSLDVEGLHFKGFQDGGPLNFDISPASLPTSGCVPI